AVGKLRRHLLLVLDAEGVARGHAPLLHRHRRQRREADDVAGGVDASARDAGDAKLVVDLEEAARVGGGADALEAERARVASAPAGEQEALALEVGAVGEPAVEHAAVASDFDDLLLEQELAAERA